MCTVTWIHHDDGYDLLSNRDEKRTRKPAAGPEVKVRDGVRFLAPTDGDAGGTWIGVNEFGVSLCLLNGVAKDRASQPVKSRGMLLRDLLSAASAAEAGERIGRRDLSVFAPFTLAILEPGQHATVIEWDGLDKAFLPYGDPYVPLVSSSVDPRGVRYARREQWRCALAAATKLDSSTLLAFHASHGARPDAYSPCMHRTDAETVSFSWVRVTDLAVEFFYTPAAPCKGAPGSRRTLALRQ